MRILPLQLTCFAAHTRNSSNEVPQVTKTEVPQEQVSQQPVTLQNTLNKDTIEFELKPKDILKSIPWKLKQLEDESQHKEENK